MSQIKCTWSERFRESENPGHPSPEDQAWRMVELALWCVLIFSISLGHPLANRVLMTRIKLTLRPELLQQTEVLASRFLFLLW